MTIEIHDNMFEQEVLKSDKPVIVDFFSSSCNPCSMVDKTLSDVEKELGDSVKIVKINIFHAPDSATKFSVMSVPTVVSFKKGRVINYLVGNRKKEEYIRMIK
jgi:thioredoxin 1